MSIEWRPLAKADLRSELSYLRDRDPAVAAKFSQAIAKAIAFAERRPATFRTSDYAGYRVLSLTKWNKIIVFREVSGGIEIGRILDARQLPPKRI
jgi:plasmid stabilization system protein ParE